MWLVLFVGAQKTQFVCTRNPELPSELLQLFQMLLLCRRIF